MRRAPTMLALAASLVLAVPAAGDTRVSNGTIALAAGTRQIYLFELPSGLTQTVTAPDDVLGRAVLSPDGHRIAVAGAHGIWIMRRDGSQAHRLQVPPGTDLAWSPAGDRLALVRNGTLITMDARGRNVSHLAAHAEAPDWYPDGTRLVFVRNPDRTSLNGSIYSVGADGRGLRHVLSGRWYAPHVSPDGTRLLVSRNGGPGVYLASTAHPGARLFLRRGFEPQWSPDGRYLGFARNLSCTGGVCLSRVFVAPIGGGPAQAYGPVVPDIAPFSWSR